MEGSEEESWSVGEVVPHCKYIMITSHVGDDGSILLHCRFFNERVSVGKEQLLPEGIEIMDVRRHRADVDST